MAPTFGAVLALILLAGVGCGFSSGESSDSGGGTQTDDGGEVTVKATWDGSLAPASFKIALDTHTVDLDAYELARLVVLRLDGGADLLPVTSDEPKGGHHREATLTFDAGQRGGSSSEIELVVRDVGGKPERVLRWQFKAAK